MFSVNKHMTVVSQNSRVPSLLKRFYKEPFMKEKHPDAWFYNEPLSVQEALRVLQCTITLQFIYIIKLNTKDNY